MPQWSCLSLKMQSIARPGSHCSNPLSSMCSQDGWFLGTLELQFTTQEPMEWLGDCTTLWRWPSCRSWIPTIRLLSSVHMYYIQEGLLLFSSRAHVWCQTAIARSLCLREDSAPTPSEAFTSQGKTTMSRIDSAQTVFFRSKFAVLGSASYHCSRATQATIERQLSFEIMHSLVSFIPVGLSDQFVPFIIPDSYSLWH